MKLSWLNYSIELVGNPRSLIIYYIGVIIAFVDEMGDARGIWYKVRPVSNPITDENWKYLSNVSERIKRNINESLSGHYYSFFLALDDIDDALTKHLKPEYRDISE